MSTETRRLLVSLSEADRSARAREITDLLGQRDLVIARQREAARLASAELKAIDADIRQRRTVYASGLEERAVQCELRHDYLNGVVSVVRTDTGDVVDVRAMSSAERQLHIPLGPATRREA